MKFENYHSLLCSLWSTVAPRLLLSCNRLVAEEGQKITVACSATGQPPPIIKWSKAIGSLPDKTVVKNGTLKMYNVKREVRGT